MGVPYSIFCCFKSTTNARLIDLESGGGGTYSTDVNTMLASVNNAGIRSAIGVGTTDVPVFSGVAGGTGGSFAPLLQTTTSSVFHTSLVGFTGQRHFSFGWAGAGGSLGGGASTTSTGAFAWTNSSTDSDAVRDLLLLRDAAGILAQRNGTAKQALRVYNTALSGAPEWAELDWITSGGTNTLRIGTNLSGTGAARPIDFVVGGVVRMSIAADGTVAAAGTVTAAAFTAGQRLGLATSGANAVVTTYNNSALLIGYNNGTELVKIASATSWMFTSTVLVQFGGTTTAFPAIKRNGTGIDIRLADDSAFAPLAAANLDLPTAAFASGNQQLTVGRIVYAGEGYRVGNNFQVVFSNGADYARGIGVSASGGIAITNGTTGGQSLQFVEMTAPAAPATNGVRIYAEDNGAGKTRIMALFATGVAQQIAIEP